MVCVMCRVEELKLLRVADALGGLSLCPYETEKVPTRVESLVLSISSEYNSQDSSDRVVPFFILHCPFYFNLYVRTRRRDMNVDEKKRLGNPWPFSSHYDV
ncbi:hypothetical protein KQX54_008024 [Cotesia glomerata]|uniref:Uncharacterized protein n=1 Tax=Cotesia glomerata TaxID=32391 RepID=A0AAV7J3P5_COTGL|nr:hypothetical protein KQX54_008024 [Cotesia glomerata]